MVGFDGMRRGNSEEVKGNLTCEVKVAFPQEKLRSGEPGN